MLGRVPRHPMGCPGHNQERRVTQPLHPSCHTGSVLMSSGQLPYPHVGTRTALISLGGREGAEPQLVVIKHPAVGRDGQDINSPGVYGPEDSASQGKDRATTAGQRDASGGTHKADGRTRKQRRKFLVEAGVEPNFPNPMVVPQIFYISSKMGSFGCAVPGDAKRVVLVSNPDSVLTYCLSCIFALILIF